MKIGVTGYKGQLGSELLYYPEVEPINVDITDYVSLRNATKEFDTIIHCAAYTDVDKSESGEGYARCTIVNDVGTLLLTEVFDGRIIYLSTDFVFDGKRGPYTEKAEPNPINHYGRTKLAGENHILDRQNPKDTIVRTTNLYSYHPTGFAYAVYSSLKKRQTITIPSNQIGNPTYIPHLARAIMQLVYFSKPFKIINLSGSDLLSRYEFALMIASVFGFDKTLVQPTLSAKPLASRPHKGGFKLGLAKKSGFKIFSALDGLLDLKSWIREIF